MNSFEIDSLKNHIDNRVILIEIGRFALKIV